MSDVFACLERLHKKDMENHDDDTRDCKDMESILPDMKNGGDSLYNDVLTHLADFSMCL